LERFFVANEMQINSSSIKILTCLPVVLFFFATLLPLISTFSYDYYNHQRICQIALLLVLSVILIIKQNKQQQGAHYKKIDSPTKCALILFIVMGLFSAVFSNENAFSFMYTLHFTLLIISLFYMVYLTDKKSLLIILYGIVLAHSALVLICLLNIIFTLVEQQPLNKYVIYSGFINIRFFNQVQVFIIPLLMLLLKNTKIQRVVLFILLLNLLLMYIGEARGALLSTIILSIFSFYFSQPLKKQAKLVLACLLLSYLSFYFLNSINSINSEVIDTSSSGRIKIWLTTLNKLDYWHLFLGDGPGIFYISLNSSSPFSHPHNSFIEILNEWGAIALLCLLTAVFITLKKTMTHLKNHRKDILTETLFYSFCIGLTYSMFSGVHVMPVSQMLLFLMWGLLLGRVSCKVKYKKKINKWIRLFVTLLFIIGSYFYLSEAISVYNNIDPDKGYIYGPRFWSIGQRV
jgi:hypothetical protein